jgi:hypothetical protein
MTTKEQWKAGFLICGMLVIAAIVNSRWPDQNVGHAQVQPAYHPPPPQQTPQPATPVEPKTQVETKYPIHKLISVNQNEWSEVINLDADVQFAWQAREDNIWLADRINQNEEFFEFPLNDSRRKPLILHQTARSFEFRIQPGTPVQTGTVEFIIQKNTPGGFDINETTKSSTLFTGHTVLQWPSRLAPTREVWLPPDGFAPGTRVDDTIYPFEDVYYRIKKGWTITFVAEGGDQKFQWAAVSADGSQTLGIAQTVNECVGIRIRGTNPKNRVVMHFTVVPEAKQNQNLFPQIRGQPPYTSQGVPNSYPTRAVPPARPIYPKSPTGPSYYPASPPPQRKPY